MVHPAEPMLDGSHHQVTHVLATDAACSGEEADGLAITAVQCEGDPHLLAVVAVDLEAIGAPTAVALIYCNPTVMAPLNAANVAIEQEALDLHHAVNPFVSGRIAISGQSLALEEAFAEHSFFRRSRLLPREVAEEVVRRIPQGKLVEFAGIGHAPPLLTEDQIGAIRDFLLT